MSSLDKNKYICKNMDNAYRKVDDEIVIMDSENSVIHRLQQDSALDAWELTNGERNFNQIIDEMKKKYENPENIISDFEEFFSELIKKKIVFLSDIPIKET